VLVAADITNRPDRHRPGGVAPPPAVAAIVIRRSLGVARSRFVEAAPGGVLVTTFAAR